MTDREAMQQALEALKLIDDAMPFPVAKLAMKNLRERLAQPERHDLQTDGKPVLQDIEQYLMQMAGICTAAVGYWKEGDGIHPDYDTPALRDVARLYAKYDALYKAQSEQEPVELCERICAAIKSADDKSVSEADYMLDSDDCIEIVRAHFVVGEPTQQQRKPDHIADVTKMVPFQDLAAELFVVAQISPADDGFSDTITRIEAWLRNHFSTPPQRKPLTDEEIEREWQFLHDEVGNPPDHHDFARAIEAKLKEKNNG